MCQVGTVEEQVWSCTVQEPFSFRRSLSDVLFQTCFVSCSLQFPPDRTASYSTIKFHPIKMRLDGGVRRRSIVQNVVVLPFVEKSVNMLRIC